MAEMKNASNDEIVPSLFCSYNNGHVPGEKYYVCMQNEPPSILCAACALCCHHAIKVFQVSLPDNVDLKCDCGNERYNSNQPDLYKFALGEAYNKDTKEDKKKLHKFRAENTHLLLQRASFYLERKDYSAALFETYFALYYNPGYEYLSTVFSELALDVGPTLGLMTEVQEGFFQAIKDLQNYEILAITVGVMDCCKRFNEIVDLAKNKVDDVEGKGNLTMLKEHFNFTFMPYIKEALDTKAASFKVINMYSHMEYEYYIEHVDVKRETKARIYVGDMIGKKYDWMGLVVKAGCDGFHMYLCPNFEEKLEIQKEELKELVEKYLVKNQKS